MPIGLVITFVLFGLCTAAALWPPKRPQVLARITYFIGVGINEIPQYIALLLFTFCLLAFLSGDVTSLAGWTITMTALLIILLGLFSLAWRARGARSIVAEALHASGISLQSSKNVSSQIWRPAWLVWLWPFPIRPRSVVRIANLRYGPHRKQRLDVYHHRSTPTGSPALLYLHGGGYYTGNKHFEALGLLHHLAEQGWVCVSANYRLRPEADFLDHLTDAKRALSWVHEQAGAYGADASRVVIAGSSAGGHLSALCAVSQNDPALQAGFENSDTSVSAVVCLYGYYNRYYAREPDEKILSSPLEANYSKAPPFFIAHGTLDNWVSVEDARALVQKLRAESSSPTVYVEFPGAQHGFDVFRSARFQSVIDGVNLFLNGITDKRSR